MKTLNTLLSTLNSHLSPLTSQLFSLSSQLSALILFTFLFSLFTPVTARAQQYNGTSGLIHIPTAEMNAAGDTRIGVHFVNRELMPDKFLCPDDEGVKRKYDSFSYYLNITPFRWIEAAYTCVLYKYNQPDRKGYLAKDRHFALKLNPLYEGTYHPSIAIGADDFLDSRLDAETIQGHFANYWISACKHLTFRGHEITTHLGYRYYLKSWNKKYQGINAALTYRPALSDNTRRIIQPRAIVEYDGHHINLGADALLFRHFLLQASLTNGTHFSGGIAYQLNLFYRNK